MDRPVLIFVEGDGDELFIKKYLEFLSLPVVEIVATGGFKKLSSEVVRNRFFANTDAGGINLVIFDADRDTNDGGFEKRKNHLTGQKADLKLEFELFLFPNHQEDGEFENLLEKIIADKNRFVLDCFDTYLSCLQTRNSEYKDLNLPPVKSKMYSYWDVLPKSRSQKEAFKNKGERFYHDPNFFDLNHPYLEPLKSFLTKHLS
ncbi:MAG: hypothetical protein MUD08_03580 [Cytophagales bacterium]|jgi:hypothetical protein|nr:hypothetical protein [Cytophagales bacterium]